MTRPMAELVSRFERSSAAAARAAERDDLRRARAWLLLAAERMLDIGEASRGELRQARLANAHAILDQIEALDAQRAATPAARGDGAAWQRVPDTGVRLDDVAGLEEAKRLVYDMVVRPLLDPEGACRWRKQVGGGLLLHGPPGTGKTLFARAIAGELEAAFLSVSGGAVLSKWFGEAERNVQALFDEAARHVPCVLFLDEADSLLPARGASQPHMSRVVSAFLAAMDGIAGRQEGLLLLGATNRLDQIDPAALRRNRFERCVYVGLPDAEARRAILARCLDGVPLGPDVDLDGLAAALDGYSGADLEALCDAATSRAWDREEAQGQPAALEAGDLAAARQLVVPSVSPADQARYEALRGRV
ncbi:MAG: ATP-binding protein [bacterium]